MSIKAAMTTYLEAHSGITAVCGQRVFPVALPQSSARPALTFRRMPKSGHDQRLTSASGTSLATFRLMAWGDSYKSADTLGEAMRQAMQGFSGTWDTTRVDAVILVDDFDDFVDPKDGSDRGYFAVIHDYQIRYAESIPTFS